MISQYNLGSKANWHRFWNVNPWAWIVCSLFSTLLANCSDECVAFHECVACVCPVCGFLHLLLIFLCFGSHRSHVTLVFLLLLPLFHTPHVLVPICTIRGVRLRDPVAGSSFLTQVRRRDLSAKRYGTVGSAAGPR
jgi:hypothetical protein